MLFVNISGAPFSSNYTSIPLSQEYSDLIDIRIRKTGFIRQEAWKVDDHLFSMCIFPKSKHPVLLLSGLIGAIQQVIEYTLEVS